MEKCCGICEHWIDFAAAFDDPLEPDDFGYCQSDQQVEECTAKDFYCEYWTHFIES